MLLLAVVFSLAACEGVVGDAAGGATAALFGDDRSGGGANPGRPTHQRSSAQSAATHTSGLAANIEYRGDELVIVDTDPNTGLGADRVVQFDWDQNGSWDAEVTVDTDDLYTISVDDSVLSGGAFKVRTRNAANNSFSSIQTINYTKTSALDSADAVPVNEAPGGAEPGICSCISCGGGGITADTTCLAAYSHSYTPAPYGVELASGKVRQNFPICSFETRILGFRFFLTHVSQTAYDGPIGKGFSHSFNMMIVQSGALSGKIITADLRVYDISSSDGITFDLPDGFFSRLTLDAARRRWTLTHFSGLKIEFYQAATGRPGYPVSVSEPNSIAPKMNGKTRLAYDNAGLALAITTDLDQVQELVYDNDYRLTGFRNHLDKIGGGGKREWSFVYDGSGRLIDIISPDTSFANISSGSEVTDDNLAAFLTSGPRTLSLGYVASPSVSSSLIQNIADQRGAVPFSLVYDGGDRVAEKYINGNPVTFNYSPSLRVPAPLPPLEVGNIIVSVDDRVGNRCDYELHGASGGPLGEGRFGIRREVCWTEKGKKAKKLRSGEPDYWETRWLQDCNCLAPKIVSQTFSKTDAKDISFDSLKIPTNWPRTIYTYNDRRQVTQSEYTDGSQSIVHQATFDIFENFSRMLTSTDPRAFDPSPLYSGEPLVRFVHNYVYDGNGNRTGHTAPQVFRGVPSSQIITESWVYNSFGQVESYEDPNGNLTETAYHTSSPPTGGQINDRASYAGYLASVTRGAAGISDPAPSPALTTTFLVNALGMVTETREPKFSAGAPAYFAHITEYNDLGETVKAREGRVTLRSGAPADYFTDFIYDGAGYQVMSRRVNVDAKGVLSATNPLIDRSSTFDDLGNLVRSRVEVNNSSASDLITHFAYDVNDQQIAVARPEGNRDFTVYDERRLPFRRFSGIPPAMGGNILEGYPAGKADKKLAAKVPFISMTQTDYDARRNTVIFMDGRGNDSLTFFDFRNRAVAFVGPEDNGWTRSYDHADNVLTQVGCEIKVKKKQPVVQQVLERTYFRYAIGVNRLYQTARDINLATDESNQLEPDPSDGASDTDFVASFRTEHDRGSRVTRTLDANFNESLTFYDAANRVTRTVDALNNERVIEYDPNSNVILTIEKEKLETAPFGSSQDFYTAFDYDERNRRVKTRVQGQSQTLSPSHDTAFAYDSRNNMILMEDAENNFELSTFDDADRQLRRERFSADPLAGGSPNYSLRLIVGESVWDRNSRLNESRAYSVAEFQPAGGLQVTRYAYDQKDRLIRKVLPDSDDPIDEQPTKQLARGPDGVDDRIEYLYDENDNVEQHTDQRGVKIKSKYDKANRLVKVSIARPKTVPGEKKRVFAYDALSRLTLAQNDWAQSVFVYDSLSRQVSETQGLNLSGKGKNYLDPVRTLCAYDEQGNVLSCAVSDVDTGANHLTTFRAYDALNRVNTVNASYMNRTNQPLITEVRYRGPWRDVLTDLGNGASKLKQYDLKRRENFRQWDGSDLLQFAYAYDRVDNQLWERFDHDAVGGNQINARFDNIKYNDRYEVTGVNYRDTVARDYRSVPGQIGAVNNFGFDSNFNRTATDSRDPFGTLAERLQDSYSINSANEYTQIVRVGQGNTDPEHDRAGNMVKTPVRPPFWPEPGNKVNASISYDAFNQPFEVKTGPQTDPCHNSRFDVFGRRLVEMMCIGENIMEGVRFIYDHSGVCGERKFIDSPNLEHFPSELNKVVVRHQGRPLLTAFDGNTDGVLGAFPSTLNPTNGVYPGLGGEFEYYHLDNRLGSTMALLDAGVSSRVLEYYRYQVFGEVMVLPVVDNVGGDDEEDTRFDLTDNYNKMITERGSDPTAGRVSHFANDYFWKGMRLDKQTGLMSRDGGRRYWNPTIGGGIQVQNGGGSTPPSGSSNGNPAREAEIIRPEDRGQADRGFGPLRVRFGCDCRVGIGVYDGWRAQDGSGTPALDDAVRAAIARRKNYLAKHGASVIEKASDSEMGLWGVVRKKDVDQEDPEIVGFQYAFAIVVTWNCRICNLDKFKYEIGGKTVTKEGGEPSDVSKPYTGSYEEDPYSDSEDGYFGTKEFFDKNSGMCIAVFVDSVGAWRRSTSGPPLAIRWQAYFRASATAVHKTHPDKCKSATASVHFSVDVGREGSTPKTYARGGVNRGGINVFE